MATKLTNHSEIFAVQTVSGNTDKTKATNEKSGQTFIKGVPVQLNAGVVQEWDGATVAKGIVGVALEDAHNLATDGAGAPGGFSGVGYPGTGTTFGKVPNQASAVNIPRGAPFVTGQLLYNEAIMDTIFEAQFDNGAFAADADSTPVQGDVGKEFGLTKDASGHWYIDRNKTTAGTNTVLEVLEINPIDGLIVCARARFRFLVAASQVSH